jgi:hypothetical protein
MRYVAGLLLCVGGLSLIGRAEPAPSLTGAARRTTNVVQAQAIPADGRARVDGELDEAFWTAARPVSDFRQRLPNEGAEPTHHTEVRIAYDDTAIYFGVRAHDPEPDRVVALLTRRDDPSPSDWINIYIDSFMDRRTAYEFGVNAAGVKTDRYWFNDTNNDRSWDAVWDAAVRRTPDGWQAELRVPFSQLRFRSGAPDALGFAVAREVAHVNEVSTWPLLARSASGYVSSFGELHGVQRAGAQKKLELMPFVLGQMSTAPVDRANPLVSSPDPSATVGLDLKYKLTPGLTLTGTVNPDFGQVEADPAVVNLGAFETFFAERRPFFVEGSGNLSFNNVFYSRRIGRAPQRTAEAPDDGYAAQPSNATILGAAKLTGKVGSFSIGGLHAVTSSEHAQLVDRTTGARGTTQVEPTTHYSVARVSQEFSDNSRLSVMLTSTQRALPGELEFLPRSALVGGIDGDWRLGSGGRYSLSGHWTGSTVRGTAEAIDRIQRNNVHSLQRPDAATLHYDPTRTALNGQAGQVRLGKIAGTTTRFDVNAGYRSPGFDINDLGFQSRADEIYQNAWFQLRSDRPGRFVRNKNINFNQWSNWNFDGDRRNLGGNINSHWTLTSNLSFGGGFNVNSSGFNDRLTRGGPGGRVPGNLNGWWYFDSDNRKLLTLNLYSEWVNDRQNSWSVFGSSGVTVRPGAAVSASLSIDYNRNVDDTQWVGNVDVDDRTHYVFGHLEQRTTSITARVNYTLRPTLSLQIYARPFVSAGAYSGFKELVNGRADRQADRYEPFAHAENPDFRVRSFRMTNVVRWEYRPGSVLFVVWQQGREDVADRGDLRMSADLGATLAAPARNTFLVKITRWLDW